MRGVERGWETYSVVGCAKQTAVSRDRDAGHAHVFLWLEAMGTCVLCQIPHLNRTGAVAADNLPLVRVDNHIVDGGAVQVCALDSAGARLPYANAAVLTTRDHPFSLAVEGDACDVARVSLENEHRRRISGPDVEELHVVVPGGSEVALVGGDTETVNLRVRVLDCPGTYP